MIPLVYFALAVISLNIGVLLVGMAKLVWKIGVPLTKADLTQYNVMFIYPAAAMATAIKHYPWGA